MGHVTDLQDPPCISQDVNKPYLSYRVVDSVGGKRKGPGVPWWLSSKEPPASAEETGLIPHRALKPRCHDAEPVLQSLGATRTEPTRSNSRSLYAPEPVLHGKRSHCAEKLAYPSQRVAPSDHTTEKAHAAAQIQHSQTNKVRNGCLTFFFQKKVQTFKFFTF